MDLVILNDSHRRRLTFYLAEEEYLARNYPDRDFFFAWQVEPSVIIGRNQLLEKEINVDFCKDNNIGIFRRKSGGGAVVADMNNIMFSYITSSDNVCSTFSAYTSMIANSLKKLGLDASDNSRNDVLIGNRKVSGNAYYHIPKRSIVHGTMLYDYDPVLMSNTLRPSAKKLESHGVESVRSRVTTIREHLPQLSLNDFLNHILKTVPDGKSPLILSDNDIRQIEAIERECYTDDWLNGKNPKGSMNFSQWFDGIGEISLYLTLSKGRISTIELTGDFLENTDSQSVIAERLSGVPFSRQAVSDIASKIDFRTIIPGFTSEKFISMIFQ